MERLLHRKALKGDPLTMDFADSALKIKVLLPVYTKPTQLASPNSFWPQFIDELIRAVMTKKCSYSDPHGGRDDRLTNIIDCKIRAGD